jgi:hypothetical protein
MATTTTNFGWDIPQSTDLVKDGATAIAALGQDIDTALVDLKGGTTGQILSKTSNTDLDYSWISSTAGDIEGVTAGVGISGGGTSGTVTVTNSMATAITTSGDLIQGTGSGTFARLATGTTGQYLTTNGTTNSWVTPSGGMTQLATGTLSGTQVNLTSISGSYRNLQLIVRNMKPTDDGGVLRIQLNNDTGTTYRDLAAFSVSNVSAANDRFNVGDSNDNTVAQGVVVFNLYDYANTTTFKVGDFKWVGNNPTTSSNFGYYAYNEIYASTSAITQINLFLDPGGNFNGGTYFLYGVK